VVKVFDISDPELEKSALHEVAVLKKLSHPLIVKFIDFYIDRQLKKAYLVLENAG
jgi:serine/threonine protein kinase